MKMVRGMKIKRSALYFLLHVSIPMPKVSSIGFAVLNNFKRKWLVFHLKTNHARAVEFRCTLRQLPV